MDGSNGNRWNSDMYIAHIWEWDMIYTKQLIGTQYNYHVHKFLSAVISGE
jgi:hypothetical protein